MEELTVGVWGFLLGFAIAAPVGPIGVLVIRRTLAAGRKRDWSPDWAQPLPTPATA